MRGEAKEFRACGRGGDGFPRQCEHWLGMTPLRGVGAMWASPPTEEHKGVRLCRAAG